MKFRNKKGQALVEFVIIMPIFLLLVLGVIDIGKILYNQTKLEGALGEVILLADQGMAEDEILENLDLNDTHLVVEEEGGFRKYHLFKEIDIVTPGLNLIFGNPYEIDVSRSIIDE